MIPDVADEAAQCLYPSQISHYFSGIGVFCHLVADGQSQAACLFALRQGNETQPRIALDAKLAKTAAALRTLARIGLAEQDPTRRWHTTGRGKVCRFETEIITASTGCVEGLELSL
jgi:hypothetical protein